MENKNLLDFTTTERDMKRHLSRYPPPQFRLKSEDLLNESEIKTLNNFEEDMDADNFQENIAIRNLKYVESKEQN